MPSSSFSSSAPPSTQSNNLLGDNVSIRQQDGNVEWKMPGGDWQTITTVAKLTGEAGKNGTNGKDGKDGKNGDNGKDGQPGKAGADGKNGVNGTNGKDGQTGAQGAQGDKGDKGDKGDTGATGQTGTTGATGATGAQGNQGIQGVAGADGKDGNDGVNGTNGTNGIDGKDGANGTNGINGTNGTNGREIELQKDLYYIQWRYVGEPGWRNLIAYSDLKGDKGDKGDTGLTGATGPANTLSIGSVTKPSDCTPTASITGTAPNQTLNLGIPGLPSGGTAGQVLQKKSSSNCDAEWKDLKDTGGIRVPSGRWLHPEVAFITNNPPANGVNFIPVQVDIAQDFTEIGIYVQTGEASSEVGLAIYDSNDGYPGSLILDAGTVSTSGTGSKTISFTSIHLKAGTYWLASKATTSGTLRLAVSSNSVPSKVSSKFHTEPLGGNGTVLQGGYATTGISGFPATAPSNMPTNRYIIATSLRAG